jgi:hypothetical protein
MREKTVVHCHHSGVCDRDTSVGKGAFHNHLRDRLYIYVEAIAFNVAS